MSASSPNNSVNWFRWGVGIVMAGAFIWVAFFDSHSLVRRYNWHQELEFLKKENARLRTEIQRFQEKLDRPLPDSVVERIAREQYGMKRPGETIYRVNPK